GQVIATRVDHTLAIQRQDVFLLHTHLDQQANRCHAGRTGANTDYLDLVDVLFLNFQRVDQAGRNNNSGAVLVIMEHRDVTNLFQHALDLKTLGRLDIFQVDTAEGLVDTHHGVDKVLRRFRFQLDIEHINTGKQLEENALAFHHWLGRQRTKITETQDGGTITDHRHQVALGGKAVGQLRLARNFAHRLGHTRTVGQGQIATGFRWFGYRDADFARAWLGMIIKGRLLHILGHGLTLFVDKR